MTVAEAIQSKKPTVVTFATPAFCQTRFCGPVVDEVVLPLAKDYAGRANFIHIEPYNLAEARQGLAESRLAHSGDAFDQQVSTSQYRDQGEADNIILAANHLAQCVFQLRCPVGRGNGGFKRHPEILLCARAGCGG
jgi:hypothetical protein